MGFDASKPGIPQLEYDFRPYVQASGITPEPSEDMVYDFQFAVRDAAKMLEKEGFEDFDPNDQEQVMKFMNELTRDDMKKINKTIFSALSELTQGRPSFDQMMELSQKAYRLGQAYMGSLMGDIMDPKSVNNVTKN
jgi:hypothetical protein